MEDVYADVAEQLNNHSTTVAAETVVEFEAEGHTVEFRAFTEVVRRPRTLLNRLLRQAGKSTYSWIEVWVDDQIVWDHLPTLDTEEALEAGTLGVGDVKGYTEAALEAYTAEHWSLLGWLGLE